MIGARPVRKVVSTFACASFIAFLALSASGALAGPSPGEPAEGLYVLDLSIAAPKLVIPGEKNDPSWSPDGRWITALDTNDYYYDVVDTSGGNRHRVHSFGWSNSGSRIAYTARRGGPVLVSSSPWSRPRVITRAAHSDPLGWAPDGGHLVYGTGGDGCCYRALVVVAANGSRPRTVLKTGGPYEIAWSPNGTQIAAVAYDQYIYLASSAGGEARRLPGKWSGFPHPEWYPDGKSFVVYPAQGISSTGGFDAVRVGVPTGARTVVCKNCGSFEFSPDRRSIAFIDSSDALWVENADGSAKRLIDQGVLESRWSSDSRRLVFSLPGGDGSTLALADVTTGAIRQLTDGRHDDGPFPGLSPDGRFVAFERFDESAGHQLWVVASDGTGVRKVITFGTCSLARWAPKGALLAVTNLDDC